MIKLDLKDYKILYELDTNSRQSYNKIGKKVGLSKDSVIYRVNKLEKEGVIKQYHTVIDVGKLGYTSFRLYLKFQNASPQKKEEIINYLKNKNEVTWIASFEGEYDIGMWVLVKRITSMNQLWKDLLSKYLNFISERWLTIFTKVTYFPREYLLEGKESRYEHVFITEPDEIKLDDKEQELLRLIAPNARISILEIAKKLRITPKTATMKLRDLEKKKVIIGYRTVFDLEKLGYQYFKLHYRLHNAT